MAQPVINCHGEGRNGPLRSLLIGPNMATIGVPAAAAKCIGPVTLARLGTSCREESQIEIGGSDGARTRVLCSFPKEFE